MPELPEVESELLYLRRTALGQVIAGVRVEAPAIIKPDSPRCAARFSRGLRGRRMVRAHRRGKYLIVSLDDGRFLILHFGMGGGLSYYRNPAERPDYTRIEFRLGNGRRLAFTCPRNICRVMLVSDPLLVPGLKRMGPEPLGKEYTLDFLKALVAGSPLRQIKRILMDQTKIAGIGNIYADEILFEAGVRPDRPAGSLEENELRRIRMATGKVLRRALGSASEPEFPRRFLVSLKGAGLGCRRCGEAIERIRIGGRSAHFCPACQV